MPQPGEIRHGRSGSVQWDGQGWSAVDVPNPMAGDAQAANAQVHTAQGDQPTSALGRFFAPILPSETLSDYVRGPAHALLHPIDSFNAVKDAVKADPVGAIPVVGNAKRAFQDVGAGNYAGAAGEGAMGLLQLLGGAKTGLKALPESLAEKAANGVEAVGKLGRFDITKPASVLEPLTKTVAEQMRPGMAEGYERYGGQKARQTLDVKDLNGTQTPTASPEDVLKDYGGRFADEQAGFSPAMQDKLNPSKAGLQAATKAPDLYDLATADKGPVAAGTPWMGDNGEVIGHTTDNGGSTGFEPNAPDVPTDPRITSTDWEDPRMARDASSDINEPTLARLRALAKPAFDDMVKKGLFNGNRNNGSLVPGAFR